MWKMPFNRSPPLLFFLSGTLALIIVILQLKPASVECARLLKENLRSKANCLKNITSDNNPSTVNSPRCLLLNHPYCLDIRLPYNSTILPDSLPDLNFKSFDEVQNYLERWRGVQKLPRLWPSLQVALCSLLMPKCEEETATGRAKHFYRPNVDICTDLVNRSEFKLIERELGDGWPSLFQCNDTNSFAKNCYNELRDLKYSIPATTTIHTNSKADTSLCQYPLVAAHDDQSWFRNVGGCALHCKFPVANPHDQSNISIFIKLLCLMGLISTLMATLLFKVNKTSSKSSRMAKVTKRCTICQLSIHLGWSLQLFLNQEVGCSSDGSLLRGQPLVANTCVLSFILTYLPSLSSLLWCAHLGKLCHEKLIGDQDKMPGKADLDRVMSFLNYGLPLALFVSVAFLGHIDGHGLYGICTVGQQSIIIKTLFVFAPSILGTIYGNYYFIRIIIKLAFVGNTKMKPRLRRNFIRISALASLITMQTILTIVNYLYEFSNQDKWLDSLDSFIGCKLNLNSVDLSSNLQHEQECTLNAKPFLTLYYLEIFSTLAVGLVISSWAFYESNYNGLRRKLIDLLEDEKDQRRRARAFLNGHGPAAMSLTNGDIANGVRLNNDDDRETYHDLIDMTMEEFARTNIDEPNEVGDSNQVDLEDVSTRSLSRQVSIRTSLRSMTLTNMSLTNSESSNSSQNETPMHSMISTKSKRPHRGRKASRARDVVLDCKRQQQQHQQQNIDLFQVMFSLQSHFRLPDMSKLQTDLRELEHGFCTYDTNV